MQPGGLTVGAGLVDALATIGNDQGDERTSPGDHLEGEFHQVEEPIGVELGRGGCVHENGLWHNFCDATPPLLVLAPGQPADLLFPRACRVDAAIDGQSSQKLCQNPRRLWLSFCGADTLSERIS